MAAVANLFDRLKEKQPQQLEKEQPAEPEIIRRGPQPIIPLAHRKSAPSEKLLAWIVNYWTRPTITLRDISAFGPRSVRDPKDAMNLTKVLTEFGWLTPVEAWRRDQKKWRVVREPSKEAAQ
jgi:hypothetical protein